MLLILLLLYFTPPSSQIFFGGGTNNCPCACIPAPPPICALPPICAQPMPCPQPSPVYFPGWIPASPAPPPMYSTSYSQAPAPLLLPSSQSYVAPVPPPSPQVAFIPARPLITTASYYLPPTPPLITPVTLVPNTVDFVTPPYLQSGLAPAPTPYDKQFDVDSLEQMSSESIEIPPPPPPPDEEQEDPNQDFKARESTPPYDYRTSQVSTVYKPGYIAPMQVNYLQEERDPYEESVLGKRHSVLARQKNAKRESVTRTNTTCNSIKLANVMMRAISEDVTSSKKSIQMATKEAFDGAKYDVFCATGEFSYSIHSRKYCEISKQYVTCFAFR
ncbi:unnamed protein product [Caenorhabditis angaria]|uniref:Ground-like domain-containing protein n=1 Tax=Caenorhabditis angaria TaxID=860376 RepID=A0A9P1N8C9_9PELO|nr:unnamed protein product [Caenorhabditis angaria]